MAWLSGRWGLRACEAPTGRDRRWLLLVLCGTESIELSMKLGGERKTIGGRGSLRWSAYQRGRRAMQPLGPLEHKPSGGRGIPARANGRPIPAHEGPPQPARFPS